MKKIIALLLTACLASSPFYSAYTIPGSTY